MTAPVPRFAPALLALLLSACAGFTGPTTKVVEVTKQEFLDEAENMREEYVKKNVRDYNRLYRVGGRIKIAAVPFCARRGHVIKGSGLALWNQDSMGEDYRHTLHRLYGLDDRLRVRYVTENTPAAHANIQAGDIVVGIGDTNLQRGKGLNSLFVNKMVEILQTSDTLPLRFQRGEKTFQINLETIPICYYPLYIADNDELNANANADRILFFTGMLALLETDDALAGILGHEAAHVFMGHNEEKSKNANLGALQGLPVDLLLEVLGVRTGGYFTKLGEEAGYMAYSPEFEAEADYAGLYAMARAGYNIKEAATVWRLMSARNPGGITLTRTHPANAARFVAISKTIKEIEAKKAANLPLMFDMKGDVPALVAPGGRE